jgi:hypothetical protein
MRPPRLTSITHPLLFYNANLVKIFNPLTFPASVTSFIDNVSALAFSRSKEESCRTLLTVHEQCLEWVRRHGASITPQKYLLVHFTKVRTKHNSACPLIPLTFTLYPSPTMHVRGKILYKKLSWQPYLQHIKSKLAT